MLLDSGPERCGARRTYSGIWLGYGARVRCVSKCSECCGARDLGLTVLRRILDGDCSVPRRILDGDCRGAVGFGT